jgi:tetratricopeptide (TPR) repeat protein
VLINADHPEYMPFAVSLLEYAIDVTPEYNQSYWTLAKYYARQNQLAKSIIYLTLAAQREPGDHMTRLAMVGAIADFKTHSPEDYMPEFEANFKAHPDSAPAALAIAMAYHGQGKYDEAIEYARKAIALGRHPAQEVAMSEYHEAHAELASILFESGDQEAGLKEFRLYTTNVARSADVRCDIAKMFLSADTKTHPEYIVEAAYNVNKAELLDPSNSRVRDLRGQLTREMHDAKQSHLAAADKSVGTSEANASPLRDAPPKPSPAK